MIVLDCKQGDDQWHAARVGLPTCSGYEKILTPAKLQPSTQAVPYRNQLLAEWLIGHYLGDDPNAFMERGTNMEAEARAYYLANRKWPQKKPTAWCGVSKMMRSPSLKYSTSPTLALYFLPVLTSVMLNSPSTTIFISS